MNAFEDELGEVNEVVLEDFGGEEDCADLPDLFVIVERSNDGARLHTLSSEDEDFERSLRLSCKFLESSRLNLVFHVRLVGEGAKEARFDRKEER